MTADALELTIPFRDGSSTSAFLSCLAARNGVRLARHFCADYGLSFQAVLDGCPVELPRLAALSGAPLEALVTGSIRRTEDGYFIHGNRMSRLSLRQSEFHVCPACLRDDVSSSELAPHASACGRLVWHVSSIRTCAVHGMALVSLGSSRGLARADFAAALRPHLDRLDELFDAAPRRPASELERYVLGRLDGIPGGLPFLDGLEVHVVGRLCEVLGAYAIHGRRLAFSTLDEDQWHLAGAAGMAIVSEGTPGIRSFLAELRRDNPHGVGVKSGPRAPLTNIRTWLVSIREYPAYRPVRELLEPLLDEVGIADIEDKPSDPSKRWTAPSITSVLTRKGAPACRPRRILRSFPFADPTEIMMPRNAPLLGRVGCFRGATLSTREAVEYLACSMPLLQCLIVHALLHPVPMPGSSWKHALARSELDELLRRLVPDGRTNRGLSASMVRVSEVSAMSGCTEIEVIHLLLGRMLKHTAVMDDERGIDSIRVEVAEVRAFVQAQTVEGPTLPEASSELRVKPEVVDALIEAGTLEVIQGIDPLTKQRTIIVTEDSISSFAGRYIDTDAITRRNGPFAFFSCHDSLRISGLRPSLTFDDINTEFYLKSDVLNYKTEMDAFNKPRSRVRLGGKIAK